jgi:hypothetical protein
VVESERVSPAPLRYSEERSGAASLHSKHLSKETLYAKTQQLPTPLRTFSIPSKPSSVVATSNSDFSLEGSLPLAVLRRQCLSKCRLFLYPKALDETEDGSTSSSWTCSSRSQTKFKCILNPQPSSLTPFPSQFMTSIIQSSCTSSFHLCRYLFHGCWYSLGADDVTLRRKGGCGGYGAVCGVGHAMTSSRSPRSQGDDDGLHRLEGFG